MLVELAIGDAYGAGFEYASREFVQANNDLTRYVQHQKHTGLRPGSYTDDTQMSIAIAEAVLSDEEWTPLNLARRFLECFHRDPREGYAAGFHDFLIKTKSPEEFLARIRPDSDKSGAAMRASPIGLFANVEEVIEKASIQAKITHDTPNGIDAAVASALTTHYFAHKRGPALGLAKFVSKYVKGNWESPWTGPVGSKGWMSVRAAITAITRNN